MPYTNIWSVLDPADSAPSSGAAADMRKIRVDVAERLLSLGIDLTEDPLSLFAGAYVENIPWNAFQVYSGGGTWTINANFGITPGASNTFTLYAPVLLPRGAIVTNLELVGQTGAAATITATLESVNTTGVPAQATLGTAIITAGLSQRAVSSGVLAVTLDNTPANYIYYYIKIVLTSGGANITWFQGVRLTYTKANLSISK